MSQALLFKYLNLFENLLLSFLAQKVTLEYRDLTSLVQKFKMYTYYF